MKFASGTAMNAGRILRFPSILAVCFGAAVALAQPAPPPPKLEPLPEIPPPPGVNEDAELEPQITITKRGGEVVEEARVNGKLKWVRVTPVHGKSYFLIPDPSGEGMIRDAHDTGLKVPLWVLFSF
jgi:hypothetical protein